MLNRVKGTTKLNVLGIFLTPMVMVTSKRIDIDIQKHEFKINT